MRLKMINMKSIINRGAILMMGIFAFCSATAQEVIKEDVAEANVVKKIEPRKKIDGVIAVVGDYVILDSDIDKTYLEITSRGSSVEGITRCELLGKLLEDKLYAHHAIQDSIIVKDAEVNETMDQQLSYMVSQIGSMEKVVQYFKKSNEEDLKSQLFEIIKMDKLASKEQKNIVEAVEITPEEVRAFFKKIPQAELPVFGAEMEVSQIVIEPEVTQADKQKVIDKLNEFRKDILENNGSFFSKAVLYSEDTGSKSNGGFYRMNKKTPFVKEFKDVAFSLAEGEISQPFATVHGYHIIYVEKIRGADIDLRHILLVPKVNNDALKAAKEKAEKIREKIVSGAITFADAARSESDEKETKTNGGVLLNPKTQDTRFELTKMDPKLYSQVSDLKDKEVSYPILEEDELGRKKYKLITVTNRYNEHTADYSQDYIKIKELALKEKQIKAIAKWSEEKIKETYIKINGQYKDCDFANNWLKK
ncbi:peptidylprolyl isomerase [Flavobacterium kingsejongi]|uniref:Peptidylprolyl isomerase n=1 Tax=Flavobacterium kingsejongi TaxID=1678728 RepID=A0A2S1LTX7_9FLAO|nr:peptidylprolyl isomerase [Flavobacterium kingsejongi]AWG27207.1 peptidylprolyl isomerase [Flavobacterium kingsejongi]